MNDLIDKLFAGFLLTGIIVIWVLVIFLAAHFTGLMPFRDGCAP